MNADQLLELDRTTLKTVPTTDGKFVSVWTAVKAALHGQIEVDDRAVDRSLQRLRKRGEIESQGRRWKAVTQATRWLAVDDLLEASEKVLAHLDGDGPIGLQGAQDAAELRAAVGRLRALRP